MKILHTADWHLGQSFYGFDRLASQASFLEQLCSIVRDEQPDAMVLSGDVFDTSMPSAAAQRLYADNMLAIHQAAPEMEIVVISGNHDSASRLEIYRNLWEPQRVHVVGTLRRNLDSSADYSAHIIEIKGKGLIAAVPYVYSHNFPFAEGDCQAAFFRGLAEAVEARNADSLPTVLMAHLAVLGSDLTGHRRMQNDSIGTVDYINVSDLGDGYDYIALGHIHHRQSPKGADSVEYSGSPLAVNFDERYPHSVTVVELHHGATPVKKHVHIDDPVPLVTVPDSPAPFEDALKSLADFDAEKDAFVRLNVLLDGPLPSDHNERAANALKDKKARFCEICITRRQSAAKADAMSAITPQELKQMAPADVASRFFAKKNIGDDLAAEYVKMIDEVVAEINEEASL